MFFKNVHFYNFETSLQISPEEFEQKLMEYKARPCGQMESTCNGWSSHIDGMESMIMVSSGNILFNMLKQDKIIPPSVVKKMLKINALSFESENGRAMSRIEKSEAKEQIINELLPNALVRESNVAAYIDKVSGMLVINTPSSNKAEELIELLRKTMGSLDVVLPSTQESPSSVMTSWIVNEESVPESFSIGDECVLSKSSSISGTIRCKNIDLLSDDVKNHIRNGCVISQLQIQWEERITATLCEDLSIKKIKFDDMVKEDLSKEDNEISRADADFAIMVPEIRNMINGITETFNQKD